MTAHAAPCPAGGLWHEPPVPCAHTPLAPCMEGCGRVRGWRWLGNDRKPGAPARMCWHCAWALSGNSPLPEMGQGITETIEKSARP